MFKSSPGPSGRIHKVVTGSSGYIIDLCCASYLSYHGNMLNLGKVGQLIESWINIKICDEDKARLFFPQILPHTLVLGLHAQSYNPPLSTFLHLIISSGESPTTKSWFGHVWQESEVFVKTKLNTLSFSDLFESLLCHLEMLSVMFRKQFCRDMSLWSLCGCLWMMEVNFFLI